MQLTSTTELVAYASARIHALGLGPNGPLGTEYVVAYDDAGEGLVRISDGHGSDVADSKERVEAVLQEWAAWVNE